MLHLVSAGGVSAVTRQMISGESARYTGSVIKEPSSLSPQDHSGEVGSPQQVPHKPQAGKLLLQKPPSEAGRAAGKPLHCDHQVSRFLFMSVTGSLSV